MIVAILDACVLYPAALRDLLMWLATVRIYSPRITEEIHSEWIRNVLLDNPHVTRDQLDRTRRLINQVTSDCLVSGYEALIPTLSLPDKNDRHVLAAAIYSHAPRIITFNLSDFPDVILGAYGVRATHPDVFLCALFEDNPALFVRGLKAHRASLTKPPKNAQEYINTLRASGLTETAILVESNIDAI